MIRDVSILVIERWRGLAARRSRLGRRELTAEAAKTLARSRAGGAFVDAVDSWLLETKPCGASACVRGTGTRRSRHCTRNNPTVRGSGRSHRRCGCGGSAVADRTADTRAPAA